MCPMKMTDLGHTRTEQRMMKQQQKTIASMSKNRARKEKKKKRQEVGDYLRFCVEPTVCIKIY